MGAGASATISDKKDAVQSFKQAVDWYVSGLLVSGGESSKRTDEEIEEYLRKISPEVAKFLVSEKLDGVPEGKEDNLRGAVATTSTTATSSPPISAMQEAAISKVQALARGASIRKARGIAVTAPASSARRQLDDVPEQPSVGDDDNLRGAVAATTTTTSPPITSDQVTAISEAQALVRGASIREAQTAVTPTPTTPPQATHEEFEDSSYHSQWLSSEEADTLFAHLKEVGDKQRPRTESGEPSSMKYPLWTLYYGTKRAKDGAIALDRWGSYHESWIRVEEPSEQIAACCEKIRKFYNLPSSDINSIVVNYYFDGDTTYIPAHRDTVACLKEGSSIFCLSLGAARSFLLVDNDNSGGYIRESMDVKKEWLVSHGDVFVLGQKTNEMYCHAVPKEPALKSMRISVIFRTVSKSFVDLKAPPKDATYASGKVKVFTAECIKAKGFDDAGEREHVADLISQRELVKLEKAKAKLLSAGAETGAGAEREGGSAEGGLADAADPPSSSTVEKTPTKQPKKDGKMRSPSSIMKMLSQEDEKKYFLGEGSTVPVLTS